MNTSLVFITTSRFHKDLLDFLYTEVFGEGIQLYFLLSRSDPVLCKAGVVKRDNGRVHSC